MCEALKVAGKKGSEVIVYPDAQHDFRADYRPSYGKADAEDGRRRLPEHLQKNGA
ncbi:MAG: dienelactone hydrolase family protein [Acidobacteriia bacterium]|nr:dienelactone hydrolase family protein [Terriglobia bacterium]